jgi:hypothetical protein
MKVKLNPLLGKIKGSYANVYYQNREDGVHVQAKPFDSGKRNPTENEGKHRTKFQEAMKKTKINYHNKDKRAEFEKTCPPDMKVYNYIMKMMMEEVLSD